MRDPETGNSRGFGFISYDSFEASDAAIEAMNGQYLCNRQITVSYAYKKDTKGGNAMVLLQREFWLQAIQLPKRAGPTLCLPVDLQHFPLRPMVGGQSAWHGQPPQQGQPMPPPGMPAPPLQFRPPPPNMPQPPMQGAPMFPRPPPQQMAMGAQQQVWRQPPPPPQQFAGRPPMPQMLMQPPPPPNALPPPPPPLS
ncbi:hypothetical protein OIU78_028895 [Salix suchowensis]|nr:hypothetical protein OIU78_028895 [Salix suchowensis]